MQTFGPHHPPATQPSGAKTPPPTLPPVAAAAPALPEFNPHKFKLAANLGAEQSFSSADIGHDPQHALPERGWLLTLRGPTELKKGSVALLTQPDGKAITATLSADVKIAPGASHTLLLSAPAVGLPNEDFSLLPVVAKNSALAQIGLARDMKLRVSTETVKLPAVRAAETVKLPALPPLKPHALTARLPVRVVPKPELAQSKKAEPTPEKSTAPWYARLSGTDATLFTTAGIALGLAAEFSFMAQKIALASAEAGLAFGAIAVAGAWIASGLPKLRLR